MKRSKRKFNIGDWVTADKIVVAEQTLTGKRLLLEEPRKVWGQIVGCTRMATGIIQERYMTDEGPQFLAHSFTAVWLVREGMFNKPLPVLHPRPALHPTNDFLPDIKINQYPWTPEDRAMMRREAQSMPRDSKGRFMKREKADG